MARLTHENNTKVHFVTTISNVAAPTAAEIAAGTNLTPYITKDGVNTPSNQNYVDSAGIDTNFDAQNVGSYGGAPLTLTMFRDDTDETDSWDLMVYGTAGYLVIGRNSASGIAASDVVEVWPVEMHQPVMMQTAGNEMQKFTAGFAVTSAPTLDAVVAS